MPRGAIRVLACEVSMRTGSIRAIACACAGSSLIPSRARRMAGAITSASGHVAPAPVSGEKAVQTARHGNRRRPYVELL